MMNNLFSMFDPTTQFLNLNWISLILPILFLIKPMYLKVTRMTFLTNKINYFMKSNLKKNLKKSHFKTISLMMMIFNLIWMTNLLSLLPFIFTPTSHTSLTLLMSLPLWMSIMMKSMIYDTNNMMIHLVPNNTPMILSPFMVLIETISLMIRPFTLMIRLTANMISSHILISLLSQLLNLNIITFITTTIIMNALLMLETSVALIQGYVFTILLSLYINESK